MWKPNELETWYFMITSRILCTRQVRIFRHAMAAAWGWTVNIIDKMWLPLLFVIAWTYLRRSVPFTLQVRELLLEDPHAAGQGVDHRGRQ